MNRPHFAVAAACFAAGTGLVTASPAAACQGPQFESRLMLFSAEERSEIPDGMVQYRVRITPLSLRDVHARDLIDVQRLSDEPTSTGKIERATGRLKVIKPQGTSCSSVDVSEPGIYYLVGSSALDQKGKPVVVNGGELFRPQFTSRKAWPGFADR